MIILWIRKKNADEQKSNGKKEAQSFQEHDDIMKRFRFAHPDMNIVSTRDILTAEGTLLAPLQPVKLTDHQQN
jgi:hypothetical protein